MEDVLPPYLFSHTMLRIKNPDVSIKFYGLLGMTKIGQNLSADQDATCHLLAMDGPSAPNHGRAPTNRQGVLGLLHQHGSERDATFSVASGNAEYGKGYGHVCLSVDNIQAACTRLERMGVPFQERLDEGALPFLAFILDPDGYWIEIIGQNDWTKTVGVTETNVGTYRLNHSMLRVKDARRSLNFYNNVLGMTTIASIERPGGAARDLHFVAYRDSMDAQSRAHREGVIELWWEHGTEESPSFKYHNGNEEPFGIRHLALSVDDIDAACERFDSKGATWQNRLSEGNDKDSAILVDPDGYWIQVIQNEACRDRN